MPDRPIDPTLLSEFEHGLNLRWPEKSRIPTRVLGYGEISTVLEIQAAQAGRLAYKRMSMFRNEAEAAKYETLYHDYVDVLQNQIGVQVVPGELVRLHTGGPAPQELKANSFLRKPGLGDCVRESSARATESDCE